MRKHLEQAFVSLNMINTHIDKLRDLDWYLIDKNENDNAVISLNAIHDYLNEIINFISPYNDHNQIDYFNRLKNNIILVIEGEKSKEFLFSFTANEMTSEYPRIVLNTIPDIDINKVEKLDSYLKSSHGGKREGAGRKKKPKTTQIRIDERLADTFKEISDIYRELDEKQQALILKELIITKDNMHI